MTNWLELQREKGESAHDAWKVGEESDSKPSAIDHVELKHLRKKLRTFGWFDAHSDTVHIKSQHRHNLVAATSQAHQMQTWLVVAVVEAATRELCTASKSDSRKIFSKERIFRSQEWNACFSGMGSRALVTKQQPLAYFRRWSRTSSMNSLRSMSSSSCFKKSREFPVGSVNRGVEFLFQAEQEVNSAFLFLLPSFRLFPFLTQ